MSIQKLVFKKCALDFVLLPIYLLQYSATFTKRHSVQRTVGHLHITDSISSGHDVETSSVNFKHKAAFPQLSVFHASRVRTEKFRKSLDLFKFYITISISTNLVITSKNTKLEIIKKLNAAYTREAS